MENLSKKVNIENNLKLHLAIVLADMSYNLIFDIEQDLKKKKIGLKQKTKQDFNIIETSVRRLRASLLQATNEYVKQSNEQGGNQFTYISDCYNNLIFNLFDKLLLKDRDVNNFFEIWNFLESLKTDNLIDYSIPDIIKIRKEK